ncbi:MAG: sugar isomerase [Legionellaceae bacterium]|nr:sugar isomerase [Legionellaceae bacterium]|tara:strand:- start:626 stop:1681 length:1056 start_codon:yes stop_codon:yes gene_type:complete
MSNITLMEQEARQTPEVVQHQWKENQSLIEQFAKTINDHPPLFVMTIARGSSDHAATFAKYLFETCLGIPVVSAAPSVLTLYGSKLKLNNALAIGISQSGKSPDLCEMMQMAKDAGAITLALVNEAQSPLAGIADHYLPLHAGAEQSVAATKSYIASLSVLIQLVAHLSRDKALISAGHQLPDSLHAALEQDWSSAIDCYQSVDDTLVIGRGYGFPIAQESALKFKETLSMHAEAFSGAEVIHGPLAIVKPKYPVLMFTQEDVSLESLLDLSVRLQKIGANVLLALPENLSKHEKIIDLDVKMLTLPHSLHPICDPLLAIQAFYPMVAKLAVARGFNPDKPQHLQKVTETR